ncbi:MAG: glycoside hydrolase family 3 protein [Chloroflexi bacterium]|nr:glycoside hydrolase family 3 protein [Chloroflexota bacterium]
MPDHLHSQHTTRAIVGQKLMLAFPGLSLTTQMEQTLARHSIAGVTLFRHFNVGNPEQVRELTRGLQHAAAVHHHPPLLIAADQEGGQLNALGADTTPFPGNMALGATADPELAFRVGQAIGREMAAMGVNFNYAPSCDVNSNPANPVVGTRAFGSDPALVGQMAVALMNGLHSAGIISCAKHFPGHGDTVHDSHHGTPVISHDRTRLDTVELPPFRQMIQAGAPVIMTAHIGLPALNEGRVVPSTLSRSVMHDLLRQEMGFQGVIVSDALDMGAITQGVGLTVDVLAAANATVDLLLLTSDPATHQLAFEALNQALQRGLLSLSEMEASYRRVMALKSRLNGWTQPDLSVVSCAEHQALALEVSQRALTLVKDEADLLPLRLPDGARIAVLAPLPQDLTPADTSSYEQIKLAEAIRVYHPQVTAIQFSQNPTDGEIQVLRDAAATYDLLIIGSINAFQQPAQAELIRELLATGVPAVTVALRTPYDLAAYPQAQTHLCTYSIQQPMIKTVAAALFGHIPFLGQLPVTMP